MYAKALGYESGSRKWNGWFVRVPPKSQRLPTLLWLVPHISLLRYLSICVNRRAATL